MGFGALVVVVVVMNLFAYSRIRSIHDETDRIAADVLPGMYILGQIQSAAAANYGLIHDYLLISDESFRKKVESDWRQNRGQLDELSNAYGPTIRTQQDRDLFTAMKAQQGKYLQAVDGIVNSGSAALKDSSPARLLQQVDSVRKPYMKSIEDVVDFNKRDGEGAAQFIQTSTRSRG